MYINFQPPNTSHAHILIGCCAFSIPFIPLESSDLELSNDVIGQDILANHWIKILIEYLFPHKMFLESTKGGRVS